jgi:hypothetical protein
VRTDSDRWTIATAIAPLARFMMRAAGDHGDEIGEQDALPDGVIESKMAQMAAPDIKDLSAKRNCFGEPTDGR